jgi:lipoprotein-releasing system permease protein
MNGTFRNIFGVEWLLAWRIVRSRQSRFLSVITVVAILGVSLGVTSLIVVPGITSGFQDAFRERILGLQPHLLIWPRGEKFEDYREVAARLRTSPVVEGVTPATYNEMMMAHGDHRAGTVVKGVDYRSVQGVYDLSGMLVEGSIDRLDERPKIRWDNENLFVENLVQETAWTLVLYGENQVAIWAEDLGRPLPDEAHVSVLNVDEKVGAFDAAFEGSTHARLVSQPLGVPSRPIAVPAGNTKLRIGKRYLFEDGVTLDAGRVYLVVVGPKDTRLVEAPATRAGTGVSRIRVLDTRVSSGAIQVFAGTQPIDINTPTDVSARPPGLLIGQALAERLNASVGDVVTLASSQRGLGSHGLAPMGMEPTSGRFGVIGIFKSGYYDYDKRFGVVSFDAAVRLLGTSDSAKWLEVRTDDVFAIDERKLSIKNLLEPYAMGAFVDDVSRVQRRLNRLLAGEISQYDVEEPTSVLGLFRNSAQALAVLRSNMPTMFSRQDGYQLLTWYEANEPLLDAMKLQKLVLWIIFLIIVVLASFNIVGTQLMTVNQKTKEIALLKALGATRWMVRRVFLIQGLIVSFIGAVLGSFVGLLVCGLLIVVGYPLEPEVYLIDKLPVSIEAVEVLLAVISTLLLTFVATFYSAGKAGRLMPVEGIRYVE